MTKEQPESGDGGSPSLEPVLRTVEYYNNIAKQLKEDLDLLGRWLQQQNPCSVKSIGGYQL